MTLKFRVLGFEVDAHASFLIMTLLLSSPRGTGTEDFIASASWLLAVTVSILVHELGHAYAFRAFGGDPRIELYSLGGMTYCMSPRDFTYRQSALISVAGPAAGFALGGLVYAGSGAALFPDNAFFADLVRYMIWVNIGWGALNLLPMLPLDGGHVMRAGLNAATKGHGYMPALKISLGVSIAATLAAVAYGWNWAALIAGWSGATSFQNLQRLRTESADKKIWSEIQRMHREDNTLSTPEAVRSLEAMLEQAKSEKVVGYVARALAWRYVQQNDAEAATRVLSLVAHEKVPDPLLGAFLALKERTTEAIPVLERAVGQTDKVGWDLAMHALVRAHLSSGEPDRAMKLVEQLFDRIDDRHLFGQVTSALFDAAAFEDAAQVGKRLFERYGHTGYAYNVACALARIEGPLDEAAAWLTKAVEAGYDDVAHMEADEDLVALRKLPAYVAIRAKAESNAAEKRAAT